MSQTTSTFLGELGIPAADEEEWSPETLEAERAIPPLEIAFMAAELRWVDLVQKSGREPFWTRTGGDVREHNEKRAALEAAARAARAELDDVSELLREARVLHSHLVRTDQARARAARDKATAEAEARARAERHRANESRTAKLLAKFGLDG